MRNARLRCAVALGVAWALLPPLAALCAQGQEQTLREKMRQALALAQRGDSEAAEALFSEIVAADPAHGPARLQLGRLALMRHDLDAAERHLEVATSTKRPPQRLFLAWHLLGRVRFLKRDDEGAREALGKALEHAPKFVPAKQMLAEIAEREDHPFEALALYRQILELDPDAADVQVRIAHLSRNMGAFELAECSVRKALEAKPQDGYLYYLLAVIQKGAGRNDAALASCQKALELGFEQAPLFVTLGDLYYETMQLSKSIEAFSKAVELDPAAAESIAAFALSSLTTEDFKALLAVLEKHVKAHPDNLNTLYSLGVMYLRQNELEKAKQHLLRLEKLAPDHAQVHYNLGLIAFREGREQDGQAQMARFQELKAKEAQEFERHNRAHRRRVEASSAASAGEHDKAVTLYLELVQEHTAELGDLIALARAYAASGKMSEAFTWLQRVLEVDPYHQEALEELTKVAEALGKDDVARRSREHLKLLASPCSAGE